MYEIENKLNDIFIRRINLDFLKETSLKNDNLLGLKIGMATRELLYVYFDIIHIFSVKINEEDIINGEFTTFNKILKVLKKDLNEE